MKSFKFILIIILAVFITTTFGFTSLPKTPYASNDLNTNPAQTAQEIVDFMVSNDSLSVFPDIAHPGDAVYFKLRVFNNTPDDGLCGGSTVRFIMNGRVVDEVPFFLNNGDTFKDINARLFLPEGEYSSLPERTQVPINVQAIVDPNDKISESNESNNSATFQFKAEGVHQDILNGINPGITIDVSGLSAWSTKNDAPNDKISAALPGQKLHLKAKLHFSGTFTTDDINIKFVLNGVVIKDFNRLIINRPNSGYIELNAEYYVPINAPEYFDFSVLLNNGSQASIKIPVIAWDVGINTGDMWWSGETVAVPGKNILLKAVIQNFTSLKFPFDSNKIAYRVLIDGQFFYEDDLFIFYDSINPTIPAYKVPAGHTTPIQYAIILDPYGQLGESDEANNTATITIPIQNTGTTGPDFSISASGLSYLSKPILPGSQVKFSAAILNNSSSYLTKDLHIIFKINGNSIADFKLAKNLLKPLQYYLVTKSWTIPQNLPDNSVFEVILDSADPARDFVGENGSDNTASIILDTYGPDLEVTADCLSWLPADPEAGQTITLYSGVRNNGLAPVSNCTARFFLDGSILGDSPAISLIPGVSGAVTSLSWQIPRAPELAPIEWDTLEGEPGRIPLPSGTFKNYKFKVLADPGNQIEEINENNNMSGEKNLTVYVPYTKAVLYIRIFDAAGNISGADVKLETANGKTALATSAEDGLCTFTGVPFGSYTITVKKQKYEDMVYRSQTIEGSLINNLDLQLIRNPAFPYFSATASTLEGITALSVDFNCEFLDTERTDLDLIYEWNDGGNPIGDSKTFNYIFVEPKIHTVTLNVRNQDYVIIFTKSFNINVKPPVISIIAGGRQIVSMGSIFVDNPEKYDADKDGINQAWEDAAMNAANPQIEFDEHETMLSEPSHKVANFVRISPYASTTNRQYILFTYGIALSKDYGRYSLLPHNGDVEKVVEAWEVIDNKHLVLRWVYTSAHSNTDTNHSGVWKAVGETSVDCNVKWWPDETLTATLEFIFSSSNQSVLKVYASEDKHAIYPTEDSGESAKLWYVPYPAPGWFVMEDVGSDERFQRRPPCINIGEEGEDVQLVDDISDIFPNERVWSGNIYNSDKFAGGLEVNDDCPGNIGGNISGIPGMLETTLNDRNKEYWLSGN